jgi:hypothetical protein
MTQAHHNYRSDLETCPFPQARYMHMTLAVSRDAWSAHQRRPGDLRAPTHRLPRLGCAAERHDLAMAISLTKEIGLPAEEGAALVESLRNLGTVPRRISMDYYLGDAGLDVDQRELIESRLDLQEVVVPSATQTVRSLIGAYASAEHRYHQEPAHRRGEWEFFSELIPGLTYPLKAIRTPQGRQAGRKLMAALVSLCGQGVDTFAGTLWGRADGEDMEGAGVSLRGLADDWKSGGAGVSRSRRRVVLEKAKTATAHSDLPQPDAATQLNRDTA